MVGGGSRRDEGPLRVSSSNVFAALDTLRRKKKASGQSKSGKSSSKAPAKEPEPQVFWAPTPLTVKSWADVDDDDDYYATAAPPPVWGAPEGQNSKQPATAVDEESESEDYNLLDDGDEDVDDEPEHENELPPVEHISKKPAPPLIVQKESERQLSKKELKKKELAELEAVLAEFRVADKDSSDNVAEEQEEKKLEEHNEISDKPEMAPAPTESKASKKKKKKEKTAKVNKDAQEQPADPETKPSGEAAAPEQAEGDSSTIDVKERLKKMASVKKKKSNKEIDGAAKAAAVEAAARSAKLAAAKKKEKNHYNQQPVR